ncbi:glutathione peroxidase [Paenibacillus aceris]|uniref:Glutathione peroxidase n=1 Tax=Paenibacillus aceris TaxID=869555 RepID=A0ABS4HTX4_9BACL|nr:glutathione peroxidase [Paenibacillus aceris]MBP1961701.1 glutathione peroxidase [Paenibacillus aceris]NHW34440.1 glutathione peroxidase [Paenibacillus aceris]
MSIYDIEVQTIKGETKSLSEYKGKALLIVNTASACGLTPHYKGLQSLYEQYQDKGLVVLGFPCNQFAGQEPGTNEEIQSFCELNYNVTFPMFAKVDVKGEDAHPLFTYLLTHTPEPYRTGDIEWNFVKFLVDASGNVVKQYSARTEPSDIAADIEAILA